MSKRKQQVSSRDGEEGEKLREVRWHVCYNNGADMSVCTYPPSTTTKFAVLLWWSGLQPERLKGNDLSGWEICNATLSWLGAGVHMYWMCFAVIQNQLIHLLSMSHYKRLELGLAARTHPHVAYTYGSEWST